MIYFIEAQGLDRVKVGYAVDPERRRCNLQVGSAVPLRLIAAVEGVMADERSAHHALGKNGNGEWFPKVDAMRLLRAQRRVGWSAAEHFQRWYQNEKRSRAWRHAFVKKVGRCAARNIGRHAIASISADKMREVTGASLITWQRAAKGRNVPEIHHLFNSLAWAGPRHLSNAIWAISRCELRPLTSLLDEAARIRGVAA